MKLRYKILYMSFGAGLVVLGMVLNTLLSGDAEAQGGVKDVTFRTITCEALFITDGSKLRGAFALGANNDAIFQIYGDDGKSTVAYLGKNAADPDDEMMFTLKSNLVT